MAQLYTIKCPKCGEKFGICKGVLMSWDFSKPIPDELKEETPFDCPFCNHTMSIKDKNAKDFVVDVIYAD